MKDALGLIAILAIIVIGAFVLTAAPSSNETVSQVVEANFPEATNYAVDFAGVLTPEQVESLNATLKAMDDGSRQVAVAIVKTTYPLDIEQYGIKLAERWAVGHEGKDDGAIIILATEDRKVRIEVGYGLEGDIPDAVAGRIIDEYMIPSLKEGKWYEAVVGGITGINNELN